MADIELVIKIPEEMYTQIINENGIDTMLISYQDIIKNGTPLPTLTDTEQRLFLSAMNRERKVCKSIDEDKVLDGDAIMLVPLCQNIKRKVKEVLF